MFNFFKYPKPSKIGAEFYISYKELFPGQSRYSRLNVKEKVNKAIRNEAAVWDKKNKVWIYNRHHHTSIFSRNKAFPVVVAPFGYMIVDGHHDVLSSIALGAEMIPIRIIANLHHLTEEQFWKTAETKGWAYMHALDGKTRTLPPKKFEDLVDDPNRYFATITARKYFSSGDGTYTSDGADYPLWLKINKDIPFIELMIADALSRAGYHYDAETMKNKPNDIEIEIARKILLAASIPNLYVVPFRTYYENIDVEALDRNTKLQAKTF